MAIEEITLEMPAAVPSGAEDEPSAGQPRPHRRAERAVQRYRKILHDRNRFTWTRRGRAKLEESFDVAWRSLVKQLAKELTDPIRDRGVKLDTRTRIYATLTGMLSVAMADQRQAKDRAGRRLRWALALSGVGLGSLGLAVFLTL